jgi:hypothetical protein
MIGFHTTLDEKLEMPFKTEVLGVLARLQKRRSALLRRGRG